MLSGCEITSGIYQAWTDLFILLNTILRKCGQAIFPAVVAAVTKQWVAFLGNINLLMCTFPVFKGLGLPMGTTPAIATVANVVS